MPSKKEIKAILAAVPAALDEEYEAGVVAGRAAALDNLDALIEDKRNQDDSIAVAVLEWAKTRL